MRFSNEQRAASQIIRSMEKKTITTTQAIYDDANRMVEAAGRNLAIAGMQADQNAAACRASGDDAGADHWGAVAALIVATGGDFDVEIIGYRNPSIDS